MSHTPEPPPEAPPATAPRTEPPAAPRQNQPRQDQPRQSRRLTRRLVQLYAGLVLFGVSMALLVEGGLGVMPWDVLHQGLARRTGLSLGTMTIIVGVLVLLAWIPLRERPGLGTVSNVFVVGASVDAGIALLPTPDPLWARALFVAAGIVLNAVSTAMYIGARFGPGPRDGLMTGLVRRTGGSVGKVKTGIEVGVVVAGWLLGGTVGLATVAFALVVGPLVHVFLPKFTVPATKPA